MDRARRKVLWGATALPLLAGSLDLFVHGNGDHAALWITTLWRMESNGVPRARQVLARL